MTKLTRFEGEVSPFASDAAPFERTTFGTEDQTDDINQQINAGFRRGWSIVGPGDQPSMQDFNALGFTLSTLVSYLYQQGVAEYTANAPYYIGSTVSHNGVLWLSTVDEPTEEPTPVSTQWHSLLTSNDANALKIAYNNAVSGLVSDDLQGAVDEVAVRLSTLEDATLAASVSWNKETDVYSGKPFATPVHKAMRRCLVNNDGTVNYYLNEFDSTKKENGIDAAVIDGSQGQVMVEIPKAYVRTIVNGNTFTYELSHVQLPGFTLHPAFDGGVEKIYIGAYNATVYSAASSSVIDGLNLDDNTPRVNLTNDTLRSGAGKYAMVGLTRSEFRTLARNGGYQLYDYWQWQLVQFLFITEFGNWNSQDVLGRGNVDRAYVASSAVQSDSPHTVNGTSNQYGNYSGGVDEDDGTPFVTYRGIENPWGNAAQWCDGVNSNNRQLYVNNNEVAYADDISTSGYVALGNPLPLATSAIYIKNWQEVDNAFLPAEIGGDATSSTFIGDALTTGVDGGWRVMCVGGAAVGAASEGMSRCSVAGAAVYRYRDLSARLSKKLHS